MQLKMTPKVGPRYWTAILIASLCGANFGDIFPDVLGLSTGLGLLVLIALFVAIVLADRMTRQGNEAFYWLSILVVRAAATNIADFSIKEAQLGYVLAAAALAALLAGLLFVHRRSGPKPSTGDLPPTDGFYWLTMLTAGALGTVLADGMGHAFGPVSLGVPISAGMATLVVALMLGARAARRWTPAAAYWGTVVLVRWWGTNFGDILAFFIGLTVSMAATGLALVLVLILWRARGTNRSDEARRQAA